jgi:CDP-glucose 4,6-dehydratase
VANVDVDPAFWQGRRALVTGHTGFKGGWLALWLASMGAEVTGLSDAVPSTPSLFELARVGDAVHDVRADIRDGDTVRRVMRDARPEVVFHMAAQPLVRASLSAPRETWEINVIGTLSVLEAVRAADGVRALVNVTSDKCYANHDWEWAYREDEPMGGHDPYSSSKGAAELATAAWRRTYFSDPDGPRLASARAGNAIGGGDWGADRLVPDAVRAAAAGRPVRVRNPGATRPWQHVLNPLAGYLLLAERLCEDPAFATAFNFGPAEEDACPVSELLDRFTALWPGDLGWEADPGSHAAEARFLKIDASRARVRLGWAPRWDLERGLAATVEWYAAHAAGEDVRAVSLAQVAAFGHS